MEKVRDTRRSVFYGDRTIHMVCLVFVKNLQRSRSDCYALWVLFTTPSSIKTKYAVRSGKPVIERLTEINYINDKAGKLVGINQHIGRRPVLAFGNSDGDFQILEWVSAGGSEFRLNPPPYRC
jgi:hypothetical protein